MRDYLFRGKKRETGEWIEGSLVLDKLKDLEACIRDFSREYHFVDPETVGQYTKRTDKNGSKIFEGDIIKMSWIEIDGEQLEEVFCVRYDEEIAGFIKEYDKKGIRIDEKSLFSQEDLDYFNAEIIGNVWDNEWNGAGVAI